MKNLVLTFVTVLVFSSSILTVVGQDTKKAASHNISINIDDLALIGIQGTNGKTDIELSPVAPSNAGESLDFNNITDNSLWLNYSSIVNGAAKTRSITANIEGALPGGTSLTVAPKIATSGNGKRGTVVSSVNLTTKPATLVDGIGSCYTESGVSKGVNLAYTLEMDKAKYADLYNTSYDVKVVYTITDLN